MAKKDKNNKPKKQSQEDIRKQKRIDRMNDITADLECQGFVRKDVIISLVFANVVAILLLIPFAILFGAMYIKINGLNFEYSLTENILLIPVMFILIVVHELIHGLTWGLNAPHRFQQIEFGFIKEMLTPYCTCGEPLSRNAYILGAAMPGIVLGILPCIYAVFAGSLFWLILGLIMISGAGGDFTIIIKMLLYKAEAKEIIIMDHPSECGFIVFEKMYSISPITPEDDAAMAAIVRSNLEVHDLAIPGTAYFDPELDHLSEYYLPYSDKRRYFILKNLDGKVIGGVGLADFAEIPHCAEVQKLYLIDDVKGKGLGKILMRLLEKTAKEMGFQVMYLETHTNLKAAISLYEKIGYKEIERPEWVFHSTMDKFFMKDLKE